MLTPSRVLKNAITGFTSAIDVVKHNDQAESVVVSVVHLNQAVARSVAYSVSKSGVATAIAESEPLGKDNSVSSIIFNDGTLWMVVSEAEPGGSGSTSKVDIYEYSGAFQPAVVGGAIDQTARSIATSALNRVTAVLNVLKQVCNIQ